MKMRSKRSLRTLNEVKSSNEGARDLSNAIGRRFTAIMNSTVPVGNVLLPASSQLTMLESLVVFNDTLIFSYCLE